MSHAVIDRVRALRSEMLRCGSVRADGKQCNMERGHAEPSHVFVTHTIDDGKGNLSGLGWAEWTDDEALIDLGIVAENPRAVCGHPAHDRISCSNKECVASRHAVVEYVRTGKRSWRGADR